MQLQNFEQLQPVPDQNIAVIILAAGSSSRLGKPKQLLCYQNGTLIKHAVKTALQTACKPVIVVTGFLHEELLGEMEGFPVQIVHNPDWQQGMGSSIRAGIWQLKQPEKVNPIDAVLILLCDQPLINQGHLNLLIAQFYRHKKSMVAATSYAGVQGVPAIFDKNLFATLASLPPHRGAQLLFKEYKNQLIIVPFEGATVDVDTEDDYLQLIKLSENQQEK